MLKCIVSIFILFLPTCAFAKSPSGKLVNHTNSTTSNNGPWTIYHYANRDYVSLRNVADFYKLDVVSIGNAKVELRSPNCTLKGQVNSKEFTINGLKVILSYDLINKNKEVLLSRIDLTKLVEPILRPSKIPNVRRVETIVLDPGHGGFDRGAVSPYGDEKSLALDVCLRARELLLKRGFKVEMTRITDTFVPLPERARFANQFRNGIFICVHFNDGSPISTGIETYTLAPQFVPSTDQTEPAMSDVQWCAGNVDDPENMALATAMHAAMLGRLQMVDRGIKRARFWVLKECTIPSVLIEGGFLSNYSEAYQIVQVRYRQSMAQAIVTAVENYQQAIAHESEHSMLVEKSAPKEPRRISIITKVENVVSNQAHGPTVVVPRSHE